MKENEPKVEGCIERERERERAIELKAEWDCREIERDLTKSSERWERTKSGRR